jgi:hypothetical protein
VIVVRRYMLVRLYLAWHAVVATAVGLELIFAPRRFITSPALAVVFHHLSPPWWGLAFLLLAVLALAGARRPLTWWRIAVFGLGVAQIAWALGLLAPLLVGRHTTNVLAPTAWIALAITSGIVAVETIHEEQLPTAGAGRG